MSPEAWTAIEGLGRWLIVAVAIIAVLYIRSNNDAP